MAYLTEMLYGVFNAIKHENDNILQTFNHIPLNKQPEIYAVIEPGFIKLSEPFSHDSGDIYPTELTLNIKILGNPDVNPTLLYDMADTVILERLIDSKYFVKKAEISAPIQNFAMKKLVLEAVITLYGTSQREETSNES